MYDNSFEGLVNLQVSKAGVGNAADSSDDVLFTFSLPANSLYNNKQGLRIKAHGSFAANGNNKTLKLFIGSTAYSSGTLTDNNKNWNIDAVVSRDASKSQVGLVQIQHDTALLSPQLVSDTQDDTAAIVIKVTGASGSSAANDILANRFSVEFLQNP